MHLHGNYLCLKGVYYIMPSRRLCTYHALGLQIAKNRSYIHTLGPNAAIIYIVGAIGIEILGPVGLGLCAARESRLRTWSSRRPFGGVGASFHLLYVTIPALSLPYNNITT